MHIVKDLFSKEHLTWLKDRPKSPVNTETISHCCIISSVVWCLSFWKYEFLIFALFNTTQKLRMPKLPPHTTSSSSVDSVLPARANAEWSPSYPESVEEEGNRRMWNQLSLASHYILLKPSLTLQSGVLLVSVWSSVTLYVFSENVKESMHSWVFQELLLNCQNHLLNIQFNSFHECLLPVIDQEGYLSLL